MSDGSETGDGVEAGSVPDGVEDEAVVVVTTIHRPVAGHGRDGVAEPVADARRDIPVDVGAARADEGAAGERPVTGDNMAQPRPHPGVGPAGAVAGLPGAQK